MLMARTQLEYIFHKPRFLATCSYGFLFIALGTLAGNSIMLARYLLRAAGRIPYSGDLNNETLDIVHPQGGVTGIAIAAITLTVFIHMFSRRGGIIINNLFAVVKVLFLCAIIVMAFVYAYTNAGVNPRDTPDRDVTAISANIAANFATSNSFKTPMGEIGTDGASTLTAILYVFYSYSGYLQPMYVLGEIRSPRKTVPKATVIGMIMTVVLYSFMTACYWLVLPVSDYVRGPTDPPNLDLPAMFFSKMLGPKLGEKVLDSVLVVSIFGNLLVMTYTSARVKQEIAKEGVLPFSRFFAKVHVTPLAWIQSQFSSHSIQNRNKPRRYLEQAPIAGLFLHWMTSTITILCVSMLRSDLAYIVLITLYGYSVRLMVTMLVSGGLLYLKFTKSRGWAKIVNFRPWLDPAPAIICFVMSSAVFFAGFAHPHIKQTVALAWYILPIIALTSPLWGALWWLCLQAIQIIRREELDVTRIPFIVQQDDGEWVQKAEIVDVQWRARVKDRKLESPA
jgi:amino acid permease